MKGLFLGAGASVECGMPLVWEFTSTLSRNILSRLDIKLFNFHGDARIKKRFASVFQSETMHYEEMVKYLENWKIEAQTPKEAQIVGGLIRQVTECIQLLLLELQEKCLPRMKLRFENYFGLEALLENQSRIEIFSLNHDLIIEELCAYFNLGLKDGFYANREHGYKNLGEFRLITSEELSEQKLDLYEGNEKGINLLKLHGSFDIFAIEDKKTYIKSVGDGSFGSFVSAIRNIESKSLEVCQKMQTRGVNELFVNDSSGELQFLRRSLLSGGHKFKGKFEQIAPVALFDAFKSRINNVQELVVIGYGFGDEHVNEVIVKWIESPQNQLTICNPYCEEIPERKVRRELIQYFESLSPDEVKRIVESVDPMQGAH